MSGFLETEVGITEYVTCNPGFFGVIKQRFSDFIVNEISSSGHILHLTSKDIIDPPQQKSIVQETEKPSIVTEKQIEILNVVAGQKLRCELKPSLFLNYLKNEDEDYPEDLSYLRISVEGKSKEDRTRIHHFIKSHHNSLNSSTQEFKSKKWILITKNDNASLKQDRRNSWPSSLSFVHFILYKENIDTMEAINLLAQKLRLKASLFSYAGTKDRRAKTSQLISIRKVPPRNLSSAANALRGIHIGNFAFSQESLKLGQLQGNHFSIVLREVKGTDDAIQNSLTALTTKGFLNYFGIQRFSSADSPTHLIGKAIIGCHWDKVLEFLLSPRGNDADDVLEAKKVWSCKRDASEALKVLKSHRRSSPEGLFLAGLAQFGNRNIVSAVNKIPRNTRMMYLHAYQSYIWNLVVSLRVKKYGLSVLPGDLVRRKGSNKSNGPESEVQPKEPISEGYKYICVLSEEKAKEVDITEVVMPLPGYDVTYPENETKMWYMQLLEEDNLHSGSFKHKIKSYSLGGTYRNMIVQPKALSHKVCFYDDFTKPLLSSDLDKLEGLNIQDNLLSIGCHKAVILTFSLPASSYATMALREILKMDTSSAFQSSLNCDGKSEDGAKRKSQDSSVSGDLQEKKMKL